MNHTKMEIKKVKELIAKTNALGNRIDLSWKNPSSTQIQGFAGVKIVRRERSFPIDENDGEVRVLDTTEEKYSDVGLKGNTIYYYTVFTFDNDSPPRHFADRSCRIAAMASSKYDSSEQLYRLLPTIYRRFDRQMLMLGDKDKGELQRFLEIFGQIFDLLRSYIAASQNLHDLERIEGTLLPLLAQWIGWQTNPSLDLDSQRNEIRCAPHFYRTIGLTPNLLAVVNRLINWDAKIKEFHHNVFRTNAAPELAIWRQQKTNEGWQPAEPFILDTAIEGAPAVLTASDGTVWLFYHAQRGDSSDIWYKTLSAEWEIYEITDPSLENLKKELTLWLSSISSQPVTTESFAAHLETAGLSSEIDDILQRLESIKDLQFVGDANFFDELRTTIGNERAVKYRSLILQYAGNIQPAKRLTDGRSINKYPTAVQAGDGTIHVFWSRFEIKFNITDQTLDALKIAKIPEGILEKLTTIKDQEIKGENNFLNVLRTTIGDENAARHKSLIFKHARVDSGVWHLETAEFVGLEWSTHQTILESTFSDMEPAACVEPGSNNIWLFWRSRREARWHIWYSRFNGATWAEPEKLTRGKLWDRKPAVVIFQNQIYVFWARKTSKGWSVFWRTKPDLNFNSNNWQHQEELTTKERGAYYDAADPYVLISPTGFDLYWRSNYSNADNIWTQSYRESDSTWQDREQITIGNDICQAPAAIYLPDGRILLWYRSSRSILYTSQFYPEAQTLDHRYAGSTTVDTRNKERLKLHKRWEDNQTYIYDTEKTKDDWYARDTVGILLTAPINDQNRIERFRQMLESVLPRFFPLALRVVVSIKPELHPDVVVEEFGEILDDFSALIEGWNWFHTWNEDHSDSETGDVKDRIFRGDIKIAEVE